MNTLTNADIAKIHDFLVDNHLPSGIGTREAACSIASINLALFGRLTDDVPACMSEVIGPWIIRVQDAMPDAMRNGEWKWLLPRAAGTGRDPADEAWRSDVILEWMWGTVLPFVQPIADRYRFGVEWRAMCEQRSTYAAAAAHYAASSTYAYAAASAASCASSAAVAGAAYAYAAAYAASASSSAAVAGASSAADADAAWEHFNPTALLDKLIG